MVMRPVNALYSAMIQVRKSLRVHTKSFKSC
uniref:Uncharacterized protein n=1 Tax=Anguilla anguilla TaxID=7936 RepID=A0A0E9U740_ANGAN